MVKSSKKKFSNNQVVVFRFGERNLVGKVCNIKQVGKRTFIYDVTGEDGKVYEELTVDHVMNHTIDTRLTKMFYQKYNIDETSIPVPEMESGNISSNLDESEDEVESTITSDEVIYDTDEVFDPNW